MGKKLRKTKYKGMIEDQPYFVKRHGIANIYKKSSDKLYFLELEKKEYKWFPTEIDENHCDFIPIDASLENLLGLYLKHKILNDYKV